jgi:hypothetical protein
MSSIVEVYPPGPVHVYIYGVVPPFTVRFMEPLLAVQTASTTVWLRVIVLLSWFTVTVVLALQPLASVRVTEYVPATRLFMSSVVEVYPPGPVHEYVSGAMPPVTVRFMEPLLAVQIASVTV